MTIHRHPDGSIDFDFYRRRATRRRRAARRAAFRRAVLYLFGSRGTPAQAAKQPAIGQADDCDHIAAAARYAEAQAIGTFIVDGDRVLERSLHRIGAGIAGLCRQGVSFWNIPVLGPSGRTWEDLDHENPGRLPLRSHRL